MILALVLIPFVVVAVYGAVTLAVAVYLTMLIGPPGFPSVTAIRVASLWPITLARRL